MAEGSVRGSIFTFLSVGLGTGILSFPGLMAKNGFVAAIIIILIGAFSAKWSMELILSGVRMSEAFSYQEMAKIAGGPKMKRLLEITIVVFVIGGCISYQIIMVQLTQFLVLNAFEMEKEQVYNW